MTPDPTLPPDLSIIIVNWNTRELLAGCLRSIADCHAGLAVQTIVVDNQSADGSREMVSSQFPGVLLLNSGGNVGFARANNLALPRVQSPLVLFLNPDTEIRGDALRRMVEFTRAHPEVGGLGCKIRDAAGQVQPLGLQWFPSPATELVRHFAVSDWTYRHRPKLFPYHDPEQSGYVKKLFGACLLVRKSVLDQVGSFDERFFMYCEDVDLCQRILDGGWRLYYLSDAEILHLGAGASASAPGSFSVLMMCESFSKLMRKHHGHLGGVAYRCVTFVGSQARLLVLLLQKAGCCLRRRASDRVDGTLRKYLTITRWTLGLQKPVIRG